MNLSLLPLTYSVEALNISVSESALTSTYLIDILVMAVFSILFLMIGAKVCKEKQCNKSS